MTATIELQSARRKLQVALGDSGTDYFRQLKLWFRKHISKDIFDTEARRLLSPEDSHLHNEFLLAILNKCQTLANLPTNNVVVSAPVKLAAGGALPHAAASPLSQAGSAPAAPALPPTAAARAASISRRGPSRWSLARCAGRSVRPRASADRRVASS